jgi:hypothetical protein
MRCWADCGSQKNRSKEVGKKKLSPQTCITLFTAEISLKEKRK